MFSYLFWIQVRMLSSEHIKTFHYFMQYSRDKYSTISLTDCCQIYSGIPSIVTFQVQNILRVKNTKINLKKRLGGVQVKHPLTLFTARAYSFRFHNSDSYYEPCTALFYNILPQQDFNFIMPKQYSCTIIMQSSNTTV